MISNWIDRISAYLYIPILQSGRSAARLAHLLWEQRVVSSNPTAPTIMKVIQHDTARAPVAQPDRAPTF